MKRVYPELWVFGGWFFCWHRWRLFGWFLLPVSYKKSPSQQWSIVVDPFWCSRGPSYGHVARTRDLLAHIPGQWGRSAKVESNHGGLPKNWGDVDAPLWGKKQPSRLEKQLQLPGKLNMEHECITWEEVNNPYTSKFWVPCYFLWVYSVLARGKCTRRGIALLFFEGLVVCVFEVLTKKKKDDIFICSSLSLYEVKINNFSLLFLHRKAAQTASYLHVSDEWGAQGPLDWKFRDDSVEQQVSSATKNRSSNSLGQISSSLWQKLEKRSPLNQPRFFFLQCLCFFFLSRCAEEVLPPKTVEQCFCVSDSQVREQFEEARAEAVQGVGLVQISEASTMEVFQVVKNHMVQHRYVPQNLIASNSSYFLWFKKKWY